MLRRRHAAVAALAIGALALTACAERGGGSETTGGGESDGGASQELFVTTPEPTSELDLVTWNSPYGEAASIDPIKAYNYPENTIVSNFCESLLQVQPDFTVEPHLASAIEATSDTTYVVTLEENVTFWDGAPMTADDVVFSLNRHLDPEEGSYWSGAATGNITSIEKTGDFEVTIELEKPDSTFRDQLATPIGSVVQEQFRVDAGIDFGNPQGGVMCTGPFSVAEWNQGDSILLERYDNYWKSDAVAKSKQLKIQFIVDPTAIANALATGEIDGSYDVPTSAVTQLSSSDTGTLFLGKGMQNMAIISTGNGAFGDPAVRRALTLATDRNAVAEAVYEGTATASKSLIPADGWSYGQDVFQAGREALNSLEYDIEAAKVALEEATADLSQPIKIVYPSERSFYADIINEIARGGSEIGLTVEPTGVPSAQFGAFFSDPQAREGYDAFVTTNYLSIPDPLEYLTSIAATGAGQNYSGFSDPAIDALLDEAKATADPDERAEITVEAEQAIMHELPWVPIADLNVRLFMSDRVTGAPASFVYLYYPWGADIGGTEG